MLFEIGWSQIKVIESKIENHTPSEFVCLGPDEIVFSIENPIADY